MKCKKITAFILAMTLSVNAFSMVGCGGKTEESGTVLHIDIEEAGYGTQWLDPLIEMFEAEHEGVTVKVNAITKGGGEIREKVLSGSSDADLIFIEYQYEDIMTPVTTPDGTRYQYPFADISDIFNENVPGEEVLFKDKILPIAYHEASVDEGTENERQYAITWMGSLESIVVNKDVIPLGLEELPRTTDEFIEYCKNAKNKGATPLVHSLSTSYWNNIYRLWMFQYYGSHATEQFYQGYNMDDPDNEDKRYEAEMFGSDGLLYALEAMEEILSPDTGINSVELQSLDFTSIQNKFLNTSNNVLFMPNGLWLEREMSANWSDTELNIEFMKMPVISDLGDKLGITDAELSAIIKWIDEGENAEAKPTFTSEWYTEEEIIDTVRDARTLVIGNVGMHGLIPSYSKNIDLAKEFMQLMATDKALEAMYASCGAAAAFKYPVEKLEKLYEDGTISQFVYVGNKMLQEGVYAFGDQCDLFTRNNLTVNMCGYSPAAVFAAPDEKDRKSAIEVWEDSYDNALTNWERYLSAAGITK